MKKFLFEFLMENEITNRYVHELYLNNNREFSDQIYDKFHVEQFHHDKILHMNLLFHLDR
jgi:hypothetical protein